MDAPSISQKDVIIVLGAWPLLRIARTHTMRGSILSKNAQLITLVLLRLHVRREATAKLPLRTVLHH